MKVFLCVLFLLLLPAPVPAEGPGVQLFFSALPDLPLMPGLFEVPDSALLFDKPEGRIVEVTAVSGGTPGVQDIRQFYDRALPQFGWIASEPGTFARGTEQLKLTVEETEPLTVHLVLTPR